MRVRLAHGLLEERLGAHDRPGDEMRKEADVEQDVDQRARRRELPAVDVDDVGQRVEGQERDRDRQRRPRRRADRACQPRLSARLIERGGEEVIVLETAEHAEIDDDAEPEHRAPRAARRAAGPSHSASRKLHHRAGRAGCSVKSRAPERVEEIADRDQEPLLGGVVIVQEPGDAERQQQRKSQIQLLEITFAPTRTFSMTGIRVLRNCSALFL